jgi:type I restriction enzyme S subunit
MAVKRGYKQTEVGVIPEDWDVKEFEQIGKVIDGDRGINYPIDTDFSDDGYCLFLSAKNVTKAGFKFSECVFISKQRDDLLNKGKLRRWDVVLTTRGTVGNFAFFDETVPFDNIRINSGMVILRNEKSYIDSGYLYATLNSQAVCNQIERVMFGSAQPQLTVKVINKFQIPIPPIAEQQAIAEALSDVDGLISALDALIAKQRAIKHGAMQELLTGQRRLPGFAGEWEMYRFEEIAFIRKAKVDPQKLEEQLFCVELEYIEQETGQLTGHTVTTNESSIKSIFYSGDVLFGKLRAYLRKYWIADRNGVCTTEIWPLVAKAGVVLAGYLFQVIQTDGFIEAASTAYGTHMPRSDWNVIKNYLIPLPPPAEQTAIAQILADMDDAIAALVQKRAKTVALKQGMMQALLTGQMRLV